MTLTDPRKALAEQSSFLDYLLGLRSLAGTVRVLADDPQRIDAAPIDDFVHVLLGVVSVGNAVDRLAQPTPAQPPAAEPDSFQRRWLR